MVKVTCLLNNAGSRLGFSFGVRAWTEMEIWSVKAYICMLKVVSSEKNLGFKENYVGSLPIPLHGFI